MANIECRKCGLGASSKCPYCRSVFPENQIEAMLSVVVKHFVESKEVTQWDDKIRTVRTLKIDLQLHDDETEVDGWKRIYSYLKGMIDPPLEGDPMYIKYNLYPSLETFCCDHEWVFKKGQKSSIGCGHGSSE